MTARKRRNFVRGHILKVISKDELRAETERLVRQVVGSQVQALMASGWLRHIVQEEAELVLGREINRDIPMESRARAIYLRQLIEDEARLQVAAYLREHLKIELGGDSGWAG